VAGSAVDIHLAAQREDSLLHACQAEAGSLSVVLRVEADAVVANANPNSPVRILKRNVNLAGVSMTSDIVERLLSNSEKT
jgi:hypothetical protein